jgi:hypothetical protein
MNEEAEEGSEEKAKIKYGVIIDNGDDGIIEE